MRVRFTKMQGAGNDFVVLDATAAPLALTPAQLQRLGDRRYGVGADQILVVQAASKPGVDFDYRIFNSACGDEVEHCGNGARCFMRYVHDRGLTQRQRVRVQTVNRVLELQLRADGAVTVDMGQPVFDPAALPFDSRGLSPRRLFDGELWSLLDHEVAVLSMGNPHAVLRVDDVDTAPVLTLGPAIERHPRFARGVNVGFMQVLARDSVRLRVFERSAGETLACGSGACAAVVAGIRLGWLARAVQVQARGGTLTIEWPAEAAQVFMTGPAQTVFEGEIEL